MKTACPAEVHLVVGGYHYYFDTDDLLEHPDSYFAHLLKDEWIKDKAAAVTIDRNGKIFRYVSSYLFTGHVSSARKPINDMNLLVAIRTEADFYGLPDLVRFCHNRLQNCIKNIINKEHVLGLTCECIRATEQKATDALVASMAIFRPATVATSRLETYMLDSLESNYPDMFTFLERARQGSHGWARACSLAHKCFKVNEYGFSNATNANIYNAFSKWPLTINAERVQVILEHTQVYIYENEGYCTRRTSVSISQDYYDGTFLYIFNSEHTGGRVTTKVNGEEVSIELPGECMALLPDCSYSVETVTSGLLVLFEYTVRCYPETCGGRVATSAADTSDANAPLVWQLHGSHSTEITPERSGALTQAINAALDTYEGVVICLSTYYPTGHSTHQDRRCETDPALLKRFDADLHVHLSTFYEVTVVTVAVKAADTETGTEAEAESGDSTARVLDFPHYADMRLKVVAPMQSVSLDRGESATMLLTGLLCFARCGEAVHE